MALLAEGYGCDKWYYIGWKKMCLIKGKKCFTHSHFQEANQALKKQPIVIAKNASIETKYYCISYEEPMLMNFNLISPSMLLCCLGLTRLEKITLQLWQYN